eukprot:365584-Chlamydomonas_euryale.AAC.5
MTAQPWGTGYTLEPKPHTPGGGSSHNLTPLGAGRAIISHPWGRRRPVCRLVWHREGQHCAQRHTTQPLSFLALVFAAGWRRVQIGRTHSAGSRPARRDGARLAAEHAH